jgi:hypothetical protein
MGMSRVHCDVIPTAYCLSAAYRDIAGKTARENGMFQHTKPINFRTSKFLLYLIFLKNNLKQGMK